MTQADVIHCRKSNEWQVYPGSSVLWKNIGCWWYSLDHSVAKKECLTIIFCFLKIIQFLRKSMTFQQNHGNPWSPMESFPNLFQPIDNGTCGDPPGPCRRSRNSQRNNTKWCLKCSCYMKSDPSGWELLWNIALATQTCLAFIRVKYTAANCLSDVFSHGK